MIKAFALDIDGVFTDGSILCTTDGDLLRVYDAKDGFAIRMAVMNGYPVGIITGGSSESIRMRMRARAASRPRTCISTAGTRWTSSGSSARNMN